MRYGKTQALDGIDLELAPGRIVGLLGVNGCGKTTLMKVLAGVVAEYGGEARVCGHLPGPASKALVSYLPDATFLRGRMRVRDCLTVYRDFFPDFDLGKARELISFFELGESMRLGEMSKGMREKVQIALVMSRKARLFLLDEPISGVDPAARQVILDGILGNLDDDALLLISTHLVHDLEPILDSVVMMRGGRVVLTGDADDLRAEHNMSLDHLFREIFR
ncbi:ABC transporter ATP-binding protein [Pseudoclavibacter endophyticus]|uniref:ABC transporter ATP-binding protein n=2 Tax=Pseudoclavibacter endophyticus TaxID=1778590 RepID=A0A6H9WPD7_9MICO|nr:ABC transporter ATP-binding protein [Pseudoclavibacter endophyticus]